MKAYFLSDVHLKDEKDPKTGILLQFLGQLQKEAEAGTELRLFLLGDIFDLWIGSSVCFQNRYASVVSALEKCAQLGVQIDYFEGNHDLHLAQFWARLPGCRVHADRASFKIGDRVVRLEHGDRMNPGDYGYKTLRWFLRTPPLHFASKHLSGELIDRLGTALSQTSSQVNQVRSSEQRSRIQAFMRNYAETQAGLEAFDILVTGHTHVEDDWEFEVSGRSVRFFNLGCWAEKPVVLEIEKEKVALRHLSIF